MCEQPIYAALLKTEYDKKFIRTGVRTQMRIIGSVAKIGNIINAYKVCSEKYYDVFVKECGKCIPCRYKQARQKACQSYCESKLHDKNCFVTLTFSDDDLYRYARKELGYSYYMAKKFMHFHTWTLENELFSKYFKNFRMRLYRDKLLRWISDNNKQYVLYKKDRNGCYKLNSDGSFQMYKSPDYAIKKYEFDTGIKLDYPKPDNIKLLHCGEYGTLKNRPHHHYICFGYEPDDIYREKYYKQGKVQFRNRSKLHDELWKYGASSVDKCTYDSINYVSRYVTKKVTGAPAESWYCGRRPEYVTQSNRSGGLGKEYFIKNYKTFLQRDGVPVVTRKGIQNIGFPRYFRELLKRIDKSAYDDYINKQVDKMKDILFGLNSDDFVDKYLISCDSEKVNKTKILKSLSRRLERTSDENEIDEIEKLMLVNGVPKHLLNKYRDCYGRYACRSNYKMWSKKYKDDKLYKKVVDFEKYRQKHIKRLLEEQSKNYEELLYFYERMRNPFIIRGYTSKIDVIPNSEPVYIKGSFKDTGGVLLYA